MSLRTVTPVDFASWRMQARALLAEAVPPENVSWEAPDSRSLFSGEQISQTKARSRIPGELVRLLTTCACHSDPARWGLMYRVLWRVVRGGERALLSDPADADVMRLALMAKAVDREVHKMHAFVRFRATTDKSGAPLYVAWFEPEHDILRRAAPFFRDRFGAMCWMIATPHGAATWDGAQLEFIAGPLQQPKGLEDDKEAMWRTYYASIFNPARLNPATMQQHMPRRYWKNLPEAQDIALLVRPRRVLETPVAAPPRWAQNVHVEIAPPTDLQACRRCPLWENATQAVDGAGRRPTSLMLVGEQPGDEEDLKGLPFVGPAGKVLDRALAAVAIDRNALYLTNSVKHFKWEPRGKRRLHKTPAQREVEACRVWLEAELSEVAPKVIVAMGATAAYALTNQKRPISELRGETLAAPNGTVLIVTYHPSAILRAQDDAERLFQALCEDLKRAASLAV